MTRKFIIAFLLATAILANSAIAFAQDQSSGDEVIKVETTFISAPVIASDWQGRCIGGLTAKDFSLYQDGARQNIDELRCRYRLGFYPPEKSSSEASHKIKVQVARDPAIVRARKNYRAEQTAEKTKDSNRLLFPH